MLDRQTAIGLVREAVESWRRAEGWSRETVAQHIVEAHERIGAEASTGIVFDPPTRDAFERMRVNADRIFRWLDDTTKDRNLLPLAFLASILAALPLDRRMALADQLLSPAGLACREVDQQHEEDADEPGQVEHHFHHVVICTSAANVDMGALTDGVDPGEPQRAARSLTMARRAIDGALRVVARLKHRRQEKRPC